jgi:diacylglycerol kinase family enzyme
LAHSLIIINPAASRISRQRDRTALIEELRGALTRRDGAPPEIVETTAQSQTRPMVETALAAGASAIVGVGGDGTLREIAASLAGTGVPLGIVPAGTGNLLAGIVGIPGSVSAAVAALEKSGPRTIDLGAVTLRLVPEPAAGAEPALIPEPAAGAEPDGPDAAPPHEEEAVFAIGCGAGFDARVMATTPHDLKRRLGRMAYFAQALRLAAAIDVVPYRLTVDGETIEIDASIALVTNMGELVPGAIGPRLPIEPDDGLLDLIVVGARGPVSGVRGLADQLLRTSLGGSSGSQSLRLRCRSVQVEADRPEPLQVDGDPVGWGSLEARVMPGALAVLVPRP